VKNKMAMPEVKQKMLQYELAKLGYPDAVYKPESDIIMIHPNNDRLPYINDAGDIHFGSEHGNFVTYTLRPIVEEVNEAYTAWEQSKAVPFEDLKQFRVLATFNNVMLAARDDTKLGRGLHFVTWRYNHDRTGLDNGFYTDDYNAVKENFASRSGLISQIKLFTQT
jgi:hypothetical protein